MCFKHSSRHQTISLDRTIHGVTLMPPHHFPRLTENIAHCQQQSVSEWSRVEQCWPTDHVSACSSHTLESGLGAGHCVGHSRSSALDTASVWVHHVIPASEMSTRDCHNKVKTIVNNLGWWMFVWVIKCWARVENISWWWDYTTQDNEGRLFVSCPWLLQDCLQIIRDWHPDTSHR